MRIALLLLAMVLWLAPPPLLAQVPEPTPTAVDSQTQREPEPEHSIYEGAQGPTTSSKVVFGLVLVAILVLMSLELVDKTIITMLGALLCLGLAYSPFFDLITHKQAGHGEAPFYIASIDWSTIGVIIGTSIFVELASRSGIFSWTALRLTRASGGDPFVLLIMYATLTVLFSAFLNNVTAMIIVGSLTVVSTRLLGLQALPYLFTEGILTNVGGLLTLISSIPNIIVGNTAGISFATFFLISAPYTVLAAIATVYYARHKFTEIRSLTDPDEKAAAREKVEEFDAQEAIQDPWFFRVAWMGLGGVILGFAFQGQIPVLRDLGLEAVALGAATVFLLLYAPHKVEEALDTVEWSLVLFFASLFVILGVMELAGVLDAIGQAIQGLLALGAYGSNVAMLWASAGLSSVTDNIPLSATLARIFSLLKTPADSTLWWAVVFGSNLGGNITPIGSASTVVAMTIIRKEGIPLTFTGFVKMALPFAVLQLVLASVYLVLMLALGSVFTLIANGLLFGGGAVIGLMAFWKRRQRRALPEEEEVEAEEA